jgi:MFS transporter, DHA1 family, multidrug resistance protein
MDGLDRDLQPVETEASSRLSRHPTSDSGLSSIATRSEEIARHATQIESIRSARLQQIYTVGSTRTEGKESRPLPAFGAGKAYPPSIPAEREDYVVDFEDPSDLLHPLNWPLKKK